VLFADLSGFTACAADAKPGEVLNWLNEVFTAFDDIAYSYGLEKIKTIGDAYMLCGGLQDEEPGESLANTLRAAEEMIEATKEINRRFGREQCLLRVGMHTGALVAGVIGKHKFSYDLWGDTVNLAARLESNGVPNAIQLSDASRALLPADAPVEAREVTLKGIGTVRAWIWQGGPERVAIDPPEADAGLPA